MKDCAKIATLLDQLLLEDVGILWTSDYDLAFNQLKQKLTYLPVLACADSNKPFLSVDASGCAIGYILRQNNNQNCEVVIGY